MEPSITSAISKGLFKQVRYLIEYGRSVNRGDGDGRTPAMLCVLVDSQPWAVSLLRLLVEKGADLSRKDGTGCTALHYCCIYGRTQLVQILLEAVDFNLNATDVHGNTGLHYAVSTGNVAITRLLVQALHRYRLTVDRQNNVGATPLIQAWRSKQVQCARILIDEGKANEEIRDAIEFKTAKEWEEWCMNSLSIREAFTQEGEKTRYNRKNRVRSATRNNNVSQATSKRLLQKRPKTAVTLTPEGDLYMDVDEAIMDAGPNNLRNNIERIFETNAVMTFGHYRKKSCESTSFESSFSSIDSPKYTSWRRSMRKLYATLEYQYSTSFRPPAKPEVRPGSPHSSEISDVFSDMTSVSKRGRRVGSAASRQAASERKKLNVPGAPSKQRKVSSTSSQGKEGLKTQTASQECSSNESLNSRTDLKKQTASSNISKSGNVVGDSSSRGREQRLHTPHPQKERPDSASDKQPSLHAIRE